MFKLLLRLPFAPVIAAMFGAAAAILVLAMPHWLLEYYVVRTGLSQAIAAAAPPLGLKARIACAALAAVLLGGTVYGPMRLLGMLVAPKRRIVTIPPSQRFVRRAAEGARADRPLVPDQTPLFPRFLSTGTEPEQEGPMAAPSADAMAEELLLAAEMRIAPDDGSEADASDVAPALPPTMTPGPSTPSATPEPIYMPQPDPVLIRAPVPVPPPAGAMTVAESAPCGDTAQASLVDLIDRFARGLADVRLQRGPLGRDEALRAAILRLDAFAGSATG